MIAIIAGSRSVTTMSTAMTSDATNSKAARKRGIECMVVDCC